MNDMNDMNDMNERNSTKYEDDAVKSVRQVCRCSHEEAVLVLRDADHQVSVRYLRFPVATFFYASAAHRKP